MNRPAKALMIAFGAASAGVGVVGAFLPILPTTPFLLLAAFLFARSSERLHSWLLGNRLIGEYLRRYYERRCMTRRHKTVTLALLWTGLALSAAVAVDSWWIRGVLGGIGVGVTTHIVFLPGEEECRKE